MVHVVQGALEAAQDQDGHADDEDDGLDEVRLAGVGTGEAGLAARLVGAGELADDDQHGDAEEGQQTDQLGEDLVRRPAADDRQLPVGLEDLAQRVDQGEHEREEAHRDEPVRDADDAPAVHPGVAEELLDQGDRSLLRLVGARTRGYRLAEFDEPVDLRDGAGKERNADRGDDQRDDDRGELHDGSSNLRGRCLLLQAY